MLCANGKNIENKCSVQTLNEKRICYEAVWSCGTQVDPIYIHVMFCLLKCYLCSLVCMSTAYGL